MAWTPMRPALCRGFSVILVLLVCFAGTLGSATATVRIEASPGGDVVPFLAFFSALRQSGEQVVIDGPCFSACTLVLTKIPRSRICVTQRAIFGFHAARVVDQYGEQYPAEARAATRAVAATYPAPIRAWIARHGGLGGKTLFLYGSELAALYPRCL